jgi:hemolysin III
MPTLSLARGIHAIFAHPHRILGHGTFDLLSPREPFSAWSHGSAALAALPATLLLWRKCSGDRLRQLSLLVYGLSMTGCYTASLLFHAARGPAARIELFNRLDHAGIYLFIAGTCTGVVTSLLEGSRRSLTLALAWASAAAGSTWHLAGPHLPPGTTTAVYLTLGWGLALVYRELARIRPRGELRPLWIGGLLYSTGAALNLHGAPLLVTDHIGAHELFHLFVVAGSACHFVFMLRVVAQRQPVRSPLLAALARLDAGGHNLPLLSSS